VIEAAPELSALLNVCPNLTLLVTSRELLRVQGEVEYPVPPLAEPEAVSLFCERAQTEPGEEIAELCVRLDSLPLAVELAAARITALSPAQILERLSQRLDLLKGGRDADPRQQTLRATIEWSYDLLSETEQQLFRRLSVFAGGCTLEAAEEVAEADLDTLQSLVEKSLLRYSNERYWMLETIREFALDRLQQTGEASDLQPKLATHFADFMEEAEPHMRDAEQAVWLGRIDQELNNLRAALAFAAEHADGDLLWRITGAGTFTTFFGVRGYLDEGRGWAERALASAGESGALRRRTLASAAWLAQLQGDVVAAERFAREGLNDAEIQGDRAGAALFLRRLADSASIRADYRESVLLYRRTISLSRELNDRSGLAASLANLGDVELAAGHVERASKLYGESLALYRWLGTPEGVLVTTQNLAFAALTGRRLDEASTLFLESLGLASDLGDTRCLGDGLLGMAAVTAQRGQAATAAVLLGASARLRDESGGSLGPVELLAQEQTVAELHTHLHEDRYETALDEGRRLDADEAVQYALASVDSIR
jgi:predicted ATPase